MSTPNSENQNIVNEETYPSSVLPKTSLKIPMPQYNFQGATLGGGFAERDYTGNVIHNYTDANLNQTVKDIQTLINQLSQNAP